MKAYFFITIFFLVSQVTVNAQFKEFSSSYSPGLKDSTVKSKKSAHRLSPGKVCLMSAILPGSGQIYNGQWYKAGVLYAGMATIIYFINWNQQYYADFKQAYIYRTDNNPLTIDKYDTASHSGQPFISDPNTLVSYREYYHHNRDLLYILAAVVYATNIIDAYVYAHLKDFDISDKLSLELNLSRFSYTTMGFSYTPSVKLKF